MTLTPSKMPTRRAFAERMRDVGELRDDFAVFESDIGYSTYSYLFGDRYPKRYFNMGIAEMATVAAAAGMAADGRPAIVCGYGVFLTMRALEVVRSFVCYPNLNVKFLSSHGGVTAAIDGVTHQATEDIAFMTTLPNMKVLVPCDSASARAAFDIALATPGPVFTRLMRDPLFELYDETEIFTLGGSKKPREGTDVTIATYGDCVFPALEAAERLASEGVSAEVLDLYCLKPWDEEAIRSSLLKTGALVVCENHQKRNGLGYELGVWALENMPLPFARLGLDDTFAESGNYQKTLAAFGMDADAIVEAARKVVAAKLGRRQT